MCITEPGPRAHRRQGGLSLVELVIAIVIVSVGLVALLIPIINATRGSADPLVNKQALAVAEAMLEEIELKPFNSGSFAGPYNCANRPQFDAVFPDYNNYASVGVCAVDGTPVASLANYNVQVTLTPTVLGVIPANQAYLIAVAVTAPNGTTITLSGFRTNYF